MRQEHTKISTRHFKRFDRIYDGEKEVCNIAYQPFSSIIPKNTIIMKFHNSFLYQKCVFERVHTFLALNRFKWVSNSRLDVALDFNTFNGGMQPDRFINRVKRDIYLRHGVSKYNIIGKQNRKSEDQYLKYGSRQSDVCIYLYNKTYEMIEGKYKEYIRESWERAGLNLCMNMWRLEFSLANLRKDIIDFNTGEVISLNTLECIKEDNINMILNTMIHKYWRFKINNYTKNKSRMRDLCLTKYEKLPFALADHDTIEDSTQYDKGIIKRLFEHNRDIRQYKDMGDLSITNALKKYVEDKGLTAWAMRKGYNC